MFGIGWQEIAMGAAVISAAAWLVRRARRAHKERVACAHCPVPKLPARPSYLRRVKRAERTPSEVSTRTK